jgi:hypothetical protein
MKTGLRLLRMNEKKKKKKESRKREKLKQAKTSTFFFEGTRQSEE